MAFTPLFKKYWRTGAVGLAALLVLSASYFRAFEAYEVQSYDWRCVLRGPRPVSPDIVMVDIWDDSLDALGAWPFSRSYHAELIKTLSRHGVKAVGFDILFVEPREGDEAVCDAAKRAGNAYFVSGFAGLKREGRTRFQVSENIASVLDGYRRSARGIGHVNPKSDPDGKVRRVAPTLVYHGVEHDQLAMKIAKDLYGVRDADIPVDDEGYFIVNYAGKWEQTFTHYSYLDILISQQQIDAGQSPRLDLEKLRGKVCFVGLTSVASHDTKAIPVQSVYPMVGMHSNILNDLLKRDFIRRPHRAVNTAVMACLLMAIVFFSRRLRPVAALMAVLGLLAAYTAVVVLVFILWGLWIDLFFPFTLSIAVYAVATLGQAILELRKREVIEKELKIASQIQKSFLPEHLPEHPYVSLAVYMKPAKAVGGDLYAFVPFANDRLGVMVGDVSGKGTPAALFMAKAVSEFKFSARDRHDPSETLAGVNDSVASESTGGLFVTMTYLVMDPHKRELVLSNGGHLPVVVVDAKGGSELLNSEEGMPIGVMPGVPFANFKRSMQAGDCFALYSDGVSEARNRKAEEFGVEALQKVMADHRQKPVQEILDRCVENLNRFMGKADQHDDITLILIKVDRLPA